MKFKRLNKLASHNKLWRNIMEIIRGIVLDSTLRAMARDLIKLEETGVVVDVAQTVENWNQKHKIAKDTSQLVNDVGLFLNVEKNRQLSSLSAIGYGAYKAEPYVESAMNLMSNPNIENEPETF